MNSQKIKQVLEKNNINYVYDPIGWFTINKVIFHDTDGRKFTIIKDIGFQIELCGFTCWWIDYITGDMDIPMYRMGAPYYDSQCNDCADPFSEKILNQIIKGDF